MWLKSIFDYTLALCTLPFILPLIALLIIIATIDTKDFGLFSQIRVGKNGKLFKIYKIRTMKGSYQSDITTENSHEITTIGSFLRKYKLDELPQLFNILKGDMSFVGPRPDVAGYADKLKGEDRIVLSVKPGITGPAQIAYRNEIDILSKQKDPIYYNDHVIWPDKVKINLEYIKKWTLKGDLNYLIKTIFQ